MPDPAMAASPPEPANAAMGRFLRVTALLGSVTVLSLAVQVVRTKLMALEVGRAGMALVAQFADFQMLISGFLLLGAEQGLLAVATDAYAHGRPALLQSVLALVRKRLMPLGILVLAGLALASPWLIPSVTGQPHYVLPGALMIVTLSAQLLVRPWQCVMNGAKAFPLLARARVLETVLSFAVLLPLALGWHLEGALYSLALTNVAALAANAWVYRQVPPPQDLGTPEPAGPTPLNTLFRFGSAALVTAMLGNGLGLLVRRRMIALLGLDVSGLYQVASSLTQQYLGLVLTAMAAYSFPAYRAVYLDPSRLRGEVNHTLRGALLVIVPIIAILLTLRMVFIRVLFSADYLPAEQMLRIQLMGDFFKVVAWSLGLTILASGRVRLHVLLELLLGSTWLLGVESLTRAWGPLGPPLAFSANQVLMCVVYYAIMHRTMGFRIEPGNWRLMALSLGMLALVNALTGQPLPVSLACTVGLLAMWVWLCVQRAELQGLLRYVTDRVRRRTGG